MLGGIYTATTGMIQQSRRLDTIANNLANINTNGYKRDKAIDRSFEDELLLRTGGGTGSKRIGNINHGVYMDEVVTSFDQGTLNQTEKSTDLALFGDGFFTVLTDNGARYTRDGSFVIDGSGRLVTIEGWPVLGEQGEVYLNNDDYIVDRYGNIFQDGAYVDTLLIVDFDDKYALRKSGDNYFVNIDPANQPVEFTGEVKQGFLEGSNVEPIREIVDMMAATRTYETNQRLIKMIDSTLDKAVNEVGRV